MSGVSSPRTSSSSSSSVPLQTPRRTTMEEEVWRDLSLSSLHQDRPPTPTLSLHYHHHHHHQAPAVAAAASSYVKSITLQDFLSGALRDCDTPSAAAAAACSRRPNPSHDVSSCCCPATAAAAASNGGGDGNAVDRRKKRMIKNRESAARSRARKQAYTTELEKEVEHLLEENRKIKMKYEELLKQTMEAQVPVAKKRKLQRTASASF